MKRPIKKYALGQQVVARPSAGTISDVYVGAYDGWNKNEGNGALLQGIGAGFGVLQGSAVMANKDAAMRASADTQRSINNQTGNYDVGMQNMQAQQGRFILKKGKKSMDSMVPGEVEQGEYIIDYDQHGEPYVYSDLDHPTINKHEDPGGGPVMNIPEGATIVPAKYADKMRRIINGNSITDIDEFKRIRDTLPEYGCGTKNMRKYEQGIQDVATGTPLTDPKAIQNQWMYGTQPTNDFEMPFQNIGKQKLPNETSDVYNHNNFMMAPQTPLQPAPPPKQNRLTNLLDNTVKEARASKAIFPYPTIMDPTYASMNRMKTMNEQVYRNEYKDGVQFYQDGTAGARAKATAKASANPDKKERYLVQPGTTNTKTIPGNTTTNITGGKQGSADYIHASSNLYKGTPNGYQSLILSNPNNVNANKELDKLTNEYNQKYGPEGKNRLMYDMRQPGNPANQVYNNLKGLGTGEGLKNIFPNYSIVEDAAAGKYTTPLQTITETTPPQTITETTPDIYGERVIPGEAMAEAQSESFGEIQQLQTRELPQSYAPQNIQSPVTNTQEQNQDQNQTQNNNQDVTVNVPGAPASSGGKVKNRMINNFGDFTNIEKNRTVIKNKGGYPTAPTGTDPTKTSPKTPGTYQSAYQNMSIPSASGYYAETQAPGMETPVNIKAPYMNYADTSQNQRNASENAARMGSTDPRTAAMMQFEKTNQLGNIDMAEAKRHQDVQQFNLGQDEKSMMFNAGQQIDVNNRNIERGIDYADTRLANNFAIHQYNEDNAYKKFGANLMARDRQFAENSFNQYLDLQNKKDTTNPTNNTTPAVSTNYNPAITENDPNFIGPRTEGVQKGINENARKTTFGNNTSADYNANEFNPDFVGPPTSKVQNVQNKMRRISSPSYIPKIGEYEKGIKSIKDSNTSAGMITPATLKGIELQHQNSNSDRIFSPQDYADTRRLPTNFSSVPIGNGIHGKSLFNVDNIGNELKVGLGNIGNKIKTGITNIGSNIKDSIRIAGIDLKTRYGKYKGDIPSTIHPVGNEIPSNINTDILKPKEALELPTIRKRNLINSNVKDAFGRSLSKDTYKMSPEELEAYGKQQLQKKIKTGSLPGDSKIPRLKGESDATYKSRVAKTMQDRKRIINIRQGKKTEKKEESESYMKVDRMGNPIGRR